MKPRAETLCGPSRITETAPKMRARCDIRDFVLRSPELVPAVKEGDRLVEPAFLVLAVEPLLDGTE